VKGTSQPTLQAKEELTSPPTLAISEDHAIEYHFSHFKDSLYHWASWIMKNQNIKELATEKVDPEETDFYNNNI
jgi:hypothetical protein